MAFLTEFWLFVRNRRKLWLFPLCIALVVFGLIVVLAETSAIAPMIYSLF